MDSTTPTPAQRAYFEATLARMKAEISRDVASGRVPQDIANFGDLHDHVDANEYGGFCEDSTNAGKKGLSLLRFLYPDPKGSKNHGTLNSQRGMDVANALQGLASAWIESGALRALPIHYQGFEHEGMQITNPTASDCGGRFVVDPKTYGFDLYHTGGGCMALHKATGNDTYILLTNAEGDSDELGAPGETFLLGTYDAEGTPTGLWEMQVGVAFSNEDDADAPRNQGLVLALEDEIRTATRQQDEAYRTARSTK